MRTGETLSWWDRDLDPAGKPIRPDVRSAARDLWSYACQQTRVFMGDPSEAPGLMEASVIQVSHYLDRRGVPLFEQDAGALLGCAFYRRLRRQLTKLRRLELAADITSFIAPQAGRSCVSKEDCRLDAEKTVRQLSERAREMYGLRNAGYGWKEIANRFEVSDAAARAEFSRELRRLKALLRNKRLLTQDPPDAGQQQ
jgi:hypothetical protein